MNTNEIPWPADPASLPRDEFGNIVVGVFTVAKLAFNDGEPNQWGYYSEDGHLMGREASEYDAVNEGALRDDYRGSNLGD